MAAPKQSTTESDSQSKYKAEYYADVALHFNKTPDRPQQYQCLASAKARLLFKSGLTAAIASSSQTNDSLPRDSDFSVSGAIGFVRGAEEGPLT
jgi:hypothetical protein